MSAIRADEHYDVVRFPPSWARRNEVRFLRCRCCGFKVEVVPLRRVGDKSGQGRYNRARGRMVLHYREHPERKP